MEVLVVNIQCCSLSKRKLEKSEDVLVSIGKFKRKRKNAAIKPIAHNFWNVSNGTVCIISFSNQKFRFFRANGKRPWTRLLQNIVICQSKASGNKNYWSACHWQITIFCSTFLNNFQVMLILQGSKLLLISLTLAFNIPSAWQSLEHGLSSQKW